MMAGWQGAAQWAGAWLRCAGVAGLLSAAALFLESGAARALTFQFSCASVQTTGGGSLTITDLPNCSSLNPSALQGFQQAAQQWSMLYSDPFTVNLRIGFGPIGDRQLGGADPAELITSYSNFYTQFSQDRTSTNDDQAFGSLPVPPSFGMLLNYTSESGASASTPYVDNNGSLNNGRIVGTSANFKALGFDISGLGLLYDATILFTDFSDFTAQGLAWDFDPSNGVLASQVDFVGAATHEIGHALGFVSGVDLIDVNSGGPTYFSEDQIGFASPLDLYRFSDQSKTSGVIDLTADARAKYFSIDGGVTSLAAFSTGALRGDGRQASHWKDDALAGSYLGLMDPTLSLGFQSSLTSLDLLAFDVIGYDLRGSAVPGPLPLLGGAAAFGWSRRLRRRLQSGRNR